MAKLFKVGEWILADIKSSELPEKIAKGFKEATENLVGVGYTPVLYLGHQLVNGTNHAVLCKARPAVKDPETYLAVVYLHEALPVYGGKFELLSVHRVDLGI